jgi:hypothetical protein
MRKYSGMPELLEQYMMEQGTGEHWVTVQELRDHFGLTRYQCNTVSGFLRRLEFSSFGRFPYIVARIEHTGGVNPSDPVRSRYLVKWKDSPAGAFAGTVHHAGIPARRRAGSGEPG